MHLEEEEEEEEDPQICLPLAPVPPQAKLQEGEYYISCRISLNLLCVFVR